jgi:HEAT repeat protein
MARTAKTPRLIHAIVRSGRDRSHFRIVSDHLQEVIDPELWLGWWETSPDHNARENLIHLTSLIPDPRVESILIECLDVPELRGHASRRLGEIGGSRAIPRLRAIVKNEGGDVDDWSRGQAAWALGMLFDEGAVECLEHGARGSEIVRSYSAVSLGQLGTADAERSLKRLLEEGVDEEHIAEGLIAHGSQTAVAAAIGIARGGGHGPLWLADRVDGAFCLRPQLRHSYYTHVFLPELVGYLDTARPSTDQEKWALQGAIRRIDGVEIRELLRDWLPADEPASRGSANERFEDDFAWFACEQLRLRSDQSVVEYSIDEVVSEKEPIRLKYVVMEHLEGLPSEDVARSLRSRLQNASEADELFRLLYAVGRLGMSSDAEIIRPFLSHKDDRVAEVAFDSLCRLTDPLRIPRHWDSLTA